MRGTVASAGMMKPYAGAIEAGIGAEVGGVRDNRPELMERSVAVAPTNPG